MKRSLLRALATTSALALTGLAAGTSSGIAAEQASRHVLVISVDGLHQSDLEWYIKNNPGSTLAKLTRQGAEFTNAQTPFPSDSYPGITGPMTGGNPKSTGIYYDDSYNRTLLPPGTADCAHTPPGTEVAYMELADINPDSLDAGAGLQGLPGSILSLTGNATSLLDPKKLPVDPKSCRPVYPHQYIKVNTVFEVARAAGLRTAWSDKHAAYEVLNGTSGAGIQDLFTPEINSQSTIPGKDWTQDNGQTMQYDNYKVQAVLNEINGYDHSGKHRVGTPAIFGMNFQTVSTAEKLPASDGLTGGYEADGVTPGPLLKRALDFINTDLGQMVSAINARNLAGSTTIVLTAKHGQSPMTPSALTRIDDGTITDALNAAWAEKHPKDPPLVTFSINDDGMLIWLSNRSEEATEFANEFLLSYSGIGNDINGNAKPFTASGLKTVYAGEDAAEFIGVDQDNDRVPDVIGIAQYGTVYTGHKSKIAEHGGDNPQDRHVALVVSGAGASSLVSGQTVETTQIAPTILRLLGLDTNALIAVQKENTPALTIGGATNNDA